MRIIAIRERPDRASRPEHALRNCFVTVAANELKLLESLVKRLVNHRARGDVTEGYATQWALKQLREPAQRLADRTDALIKY